MSKLDRLINASRFWQWIFLALLIFGAALHLTTLTYSPVPWIDEVQIVEIGQGGIGEKTSGWNMCTTGVAEFDKQAWAPYYLGGLGEELCYQALGRFGPRSFTLLGLLVATLLFYLYVRRRTKSDFWATVLGLTFFAFPALVQSVRGARVDVWAFVCLWAGLNLLYNAHLSVGLKRTLRFALAGSIAVLGCFFWASAALMGPIYLWAFFENFDHPIKRWKEWFAPAVCVAMGVSTALALALIPFYGQLQTTIELATWVSQHNSNSATWDNILPALKSFCSTAVGFPFVFLLGIIGVFVSRKCNWLKLGVLAIFILCVFVAARIYVFRMLYLSAYTFLGLVLLVLSTKTHLRLGKVFSILLTLISFATFTRSVIARNGIEFLARHGRDYQMLKTTLEREIGRNAVAYSDSFQIYYAARDLGWRLYRDGSGDPAKCNNKIWSEIQYVIVDASAPNLEQFCVMHGFTEKKQIVLTKPTLPPFAKKILFRLKRINTWGPYIVYERNYSCEHK